MSRSKDVFSSSHNKSKRHNKSSNCSNPHCYYKPTKLLYKCKNKCSSVSYCSENCMRQHWITGHQFDCILQSTFTANNVLS